jgi:ribosomal protein S18 acetylase RimI-like enzyme
MNKEDLKTVKEISEKYLPERYSTGLLKKLVRMWPEASRIAEDENQVVGFSIGRRDGMKARLAIIAVEEKYRGKGIGTDLLRAFEELTRKSRIKCMNLFVEVSNVNAISFYEKRGFRIVERKPKIYKNGSDAFLMEKNI